MNTKKLLDDSRILSRELHKLRNMLLFDSGTMTGSEIISVIEKEELLQLQLEDLALELECYIELCQDSFIRDIIRLYYICGLTEAEISRIKGCSRPNVSVKIKEFWKLIKWKA